MTLPVPANTTLDVLLTAFQTKLISCGVFQRNQVFISVNPEMLEFPINDQFAVISPGKQVVDEHVRIGAGRDVIDVDGLIEIYIYSRLLLDEVPRDDYFLNDSGLGVIQLFNCVFNCLEQYQPLDINGNQLMPVPLELVSLDTYQRRIDKAGWGCLITTWKLFYTYLLGC